MKYNFVKKMKLQNLHNIIFMASNLNMITVDRRFIPKILDSL